MSTTTTTTTTTTTSGGVTTTVTTTVTTAADPVEEAEPLAPGERSAEQKAFLIEHYPKNLDGIKANWLGALLKTAVSEFVSLKLEQQQRHACPVAQPLLIRARERRRSRSSWRRA